VPPNHDRVSADRLVRAGLDIGRLPWVKPLLLAYEQDYESVAAFFAGNPRVPGDWHAMVARVGSDGRDRGAVSAVVAAELESRGAPSEARAAVETLARPGSVAVLTGQQAGLFGGPLYTLFKAVTAIQLARQVSRQQGVDAVPIFWIASEDHDWDEVRTTVVLDAEGRLCRVTAPDVAGSGDQPVGALTFDERIGQTITALEQRLPKTPWTADLVDALRRHYRVGSNLGRALAGWLDELLGRHGLIVFDGSDPAAKPLVADLFVRELESPERTAESVRAQGEALRALGHGAQIVPAEHATALFYLDAGGRHPVRFADGQFLVGRSARPTGELLQEAVAHPERFSPNVMLRPIVQDRLFPTICYVAGPGELAYQAQFGPIYESFGVERPLFASRASATVLDRATARFIDKHDVSFEELAITDDSVLNRLVADRLVPEIGSTVSDLERTIAEGMDRMSAAAAGVDPTLAGAADTTARRMRLALDTLERKIVRAAKRSDETLRRQFEHARTVSFPNGQPQDRVLGVAAVLNQYGPALLDELVDQLPVDGGRHYLLVP